ncbi:MAG: hypothetical protein BGO63_11455 [Candidatus Accumulibacter sp. 66-26]|nr:hypothetical protein [Accumulibacter sp.]OJW51610.1 MAG: hypothetical protein BGO63_11455 [Candidatus Accumulibacter sp. 66-26]
MDNLIRDGAPLELFAWLDADAELPAWDRLKGCPFGAAHGALAGAAPRPDDELSTVQNYFAEYHLEYFRQRRFNHFPSRLHALLLFATRIDADTYRSKHPARVYGKHQVRARTQGAYLCSFHDASWLDYLRLPHSLGFGALDEIAEHYWSGRTVEDIGLTFMNEPWREAPVIEALFQGALEAVSGAPRTAWLPGFA